MKTSILVFAMLAGSAAGAWAQDRDAAPGSAPPDRNSPAVFTVEEEVADGAISPDLGPSRFGSAGYAGLSSEFGAFGFGRRRSLEYLALADVDDPYQGDTTSNEASLSGGGRRIDHSLQFRSARVRGVTAGTSYGMDGIDGSAANRAWGMSVGVETGPITLRIAHQNRHVAKVRLYDLAGNNMEARNSIVAANVRLGWGTAYAAYSVNRGWGSSPLFNPDNPYGASVATTPSTDSRDVLAGVAVPLGHYTTLLASFIHKNDRDLANQDANQLAVGATYAVSRRTDVYAAWSRIANLNAGGFVPGLVERARISTALNFGFRHAF